MSLIQSSNILEEISTFKWGHSICRNRFMNHKKGHSSQGRRKERKQRHSPHGGIHVCAISSSNLGGFMSSSTHFDSKGQGQLILASFMYCAMLLCHLVIIIYLASMSSWSIPKQVCCCWLWLSNSNQQVRVTSYQTCAVLSCPSTLPSFAFLMQPNPEITDSAPYWRQGLKIWYDMIWGSFSIFCWLVKGKKWFQM